MSERKLPSPIYAAAGASEIVVEQIKKLPGKVEELRDRAKLEERFNSFNTSVRENVAKGVETFKGLDADKLRETASETATTLGGKAKEAGEKARHTYLELVERGEHVANGERSPIKVIATIANPSSGNGNGNGSQPAAEKATTETEKPTAEKPAAEKAADKPAAEKPTDSKKAPTPKPAAKPVHPTAKKSAAAKLYIRIDQATGVDAGGLIFFADVLVYNMEPMRSTMMSDRTPEFGQPPKWCSAITSWVSRDITGEPDEPNIVSQKYDTSLLEA